MNTELIEQTWMALGERQRDFVGRFYDRFFERFPGYRKLFPRELREEHLEKMLQAVALMCDLAEDRADIAPHLRKLGAAHKPFELAQRDFGNFRDVFVETLGQHAGEQWTAAAAQAWGEAFDQVLYPLMREGAAARA